MPLRDRLILCAILGMALLLRLIGLNAPLWYDEVVTIVEFARQPTFDLMADYSSFNNHLLYSLQAKASIFLFGESAWTLRLPAALFGVAGIAAVWWLARPLVGTAQAHVTAALIALSYHHVWFSQNGRAYTGLMFWWIIATIVFVAGIRKPARKVWILYALVVAVAMYTHLTAGIFVAVHGLVYGLLLLGRWWGGARLGHNYKMVGSGKTQFVPLIGFVLGGVLTLALYAPAVSAIVEQLGSVSETSKVDLMKEYQNPFWTMLEVVRSLPGPTWATGTAVLAALFLMLVGALGIGRKEPIVAGAALLFIPITFAILIALSMRIWPRFFFAELGFIFLFVTHGVFLVSRYLSHQVRRITNRPSGDLPIFGLAVFLMIGISCALLVKNYRHPKQDLAGALAYIEKNQKEDATVATIGLAAYPYQEYFAKDWPEVNDSSELRSVMTGSPETWAVVIFPGRTERDMPDVMRILEKEFGLAKVFPGTLGGGYVLVYSTSSRGDETTP